MEFRCFRKKFTLASVPTDPVNFRVMAADRYFMWINGKLVAFDGGIRRGPTPTGSYVDLVNAKPYLSVGENLISVLVMHFNRESVSHNPARSGTTLKPVFFCDTRGLGGSSDATWKTTAHPSFEVPVSTPATHGQLARESVRIDQDGSLGTFDLSADINAVTGIEWAWDKTFSDAGWASAGAYGSARWYEPPGLPVDPSPPPPTTWGQLHPRLIKQHEIATSKTAFANTTEIFDATLVVFQHPTYADPSDGAGISLPRVNSTGYAELIACKLPSLQHFVPIIGVDGNDGDVVTVYTNHRDIATRTGSQDASAISIELELSATYGVVELPVWLCGEYLIIEVPDGATLNYAGYRAVGQMPTKQGDFSCSNANIATLFDKAVETYKACLHDTFMANWNRFPGQAKGEAATLMSGGFYTFDPESVDRMAQKMLRAAKEWYNYHPGSPAAAFRTSSTHPSGPNDAGITGTGLTYEEPSTELMFLGLEGIWRYYLHTGNFTPLSNIYANLKNYLESFTITGGIPVVKGQTGSPVEINDWYDWYDPNHSPQAGDWGGNTNAAEADHRMILTAWFYMATKAAREIALVKGSLSADVAVYDGWISGIESAISGSDHWSGTEYITSGFGFTADQRANAMLAFAGLVPADRKTAVADYIYQDGVTTPKGGVWMEIWTAAALVKLGFATRARQRLVKRFVTDNAILADWHKGLPEMWENEALGAVSHATGGAFMMMLSRYFAGVDILNAGYEKYVIAPNQADFTSITCSVPTKKGLLTANSSFNSGTKQDTFTTTLLKGGVLRIEIPRNSSPNGEVVTLDGTEVYNNGVAPTLPFGVSFISTTNDRIIFQVNGSAYDPGSLVWVYDYEP